MERTIKFKLLSQKGLVSVMTSAATFGEAKQLRELQNIDWGNNVLVDTDTQQTLTSDSSMLPTKNGAIMFVMPTKTKAGK